MFTIGEAAFVAITLMQQSWSAADSSRRNAYNMVAISESTPGPIGINMATYIGYEMYGIPGGIIATIGTVLPSLVVIIVIARYFGKFQEKPLVKAAFFGLRAGTTGMIAVAAFQVILVAVLSLDSFSRTGRWQDIADWRAFAFFCIIFVLQVKIDWHPVFFIILGAVFALSFVITDFALFNLNTQKFAKS